MEKLFDLDELHASYRKKKFRNVSIAVLIFIVVVIGLVSLVPHTRNSNAAVNLTGLANPINRDASTTQPTSPTIQQSTNSNSTVQPTPKTGDYSPSYTYTVPNSSSTAQGTTSIAAPDPSKCPGIRAQMASATASLDAQAAQLRSQIQTEQSYITNNSSYDWHSGYGQAPPTDTSSQQAQLQQDQQQLSSIVSQINTINNSFIPQLAGNMCP